MSDTIFKIPKLKRSSNYDIQSIKIEALLTKEGYLEVIVYNLSSLSKATRVLLQDKAIKATSFIKLALEDRPLLQVRYISNLYLLQQMLKNLYKVKEFSSKFLISKELINTTINSYKGNLELYINNFKRLANSLEAKEISLPNKFLVALLLNNLNKDYKYIVTIITQTIRIDNNSVDLDTIISQLLDKSRRVNSIKNKNSTSNSNNKNNSFSYNYSTSNNYNTSNNNNNKRNSIKSSNNEDIEMSMSTTKKNNNNKSNNNNIKTCNYYKKKEHLESNCFKKYSNLIKNKSINNTTKEETILTSSIVNKDNSNSTIDFILDSSATIHTYYIKELFINIKPSITTIKQSNTNNNIKASSIGDILVKFTSTNKLVKLTNVLYIL